ncbi:DUF4307 domain-containing protein [Nocardia sp. NBC_01329]|uniref:DUF4307 domain-containing protein n=1 Tax=Nocardia sp. NBC_01329 TaxID=2903594 RepID=UPI002E0DA308|nr:DUF4307 domain-containing protein [Nocardia sp. NBC_01329]
MTEPTPDPGHADSTGSPTTASPEAADSARDRYADRYGRRTARPNRRLLGAALTGVVVLAGIGVAYLGWTKFGPEDIEFEELGYTVLDDSSVEVQIRLTRDDPSKPVVCLVRAMARDLEEVGRREVLVQPATGEKTVRVSTVVEASEPPASAAIYTCTDQVPGYLRTE